MAAGARAALLWVLSCGLTGCGASDSSGGVSGSVGVGGGADTSATVTAGTGTGTGGSSATGGSTSGTTGTGGISVAQCLQQCFDDFSPNGPDKYKPLMQCVYCGQCYVDCDGKTAVDAQDQLLCVEPGTGTSCDNSGACGTCADCAIETACSKESMDCKMEPDCVAYANCVASCDHK